MSFDRTRQGHGQVKEVSRYTSAGWKQPVLLNCLIQNAKSTWVNFSPCTLDNPYHIVCVYTILLECLFKIFSTLITKKTSKSSAAENVSMSWHDHDTCLFIGRCPFALYNGLTHYDKINDTSTDAIDLSDAPLTAILLCSIAISVLWCIECNISGINSILQSLIDTCFNMGFTVSLGKYYLHPKLVHYRTASYVRNWFLLLVTSYVFWGLDFVDLGTVVFEYCFRKYFLVTLRMCSLYHVCSFVFDTLP